MFDILIYLFENYLEEGIHPDRQILERELSLAGFDSNDINQAFAWLSDLDTLSQSSYSSHLADSRAIRCYSEPESARIDQECRGFLTFLESSNILNPVQREWVIDRALALPDREVTLEKVKWIVLIVLWRQGATQDYLLLEDLLFGDSQPLMH